jgi:hypothetical protein
MTPTDARTDVNGPPPESGAKQRSALTVDLTTWGWRRALASRSRGRIEERAESTVVAAARDNGINLSRKQRKAAIAAIVDAALAERSSCTVTCGDGE